MSEVGGRPPAGRVSTVSESSAQMAVRWEKGADGIAIVTLDDPELHDPFTAIWRWVKSSGTPPR